VDSANGVVSIVLKKARDQPLMHQGHYERLKNAILLTVVEKKSFRGQSRYYPGVPFLKTKDAAIEPLKPIFLNQALKAE